MWEILIGPENVSVGGKMLGRKCRVDGDDVFGCTFLETKIDSCKGFRYRASM